MSCGDRHLRVLFGSFSSPKQRLHEHPSRVDKVAHTGSIAHIRPTDRSPRSTLRSPISYRSPRSKHTQIIYVPQITSGDIPRSPMSHRSPRANILRSPCPTDHLRPTYPDHVRPTDHLVPNILRSPMSHRSPVVQTCPDHLP